MKISTFIIYGIATAFTGFLVLNGDNNYNLKAQTNRLNFSKDNNITVYPPLLLTVIPLIK